MKMHKYALAFAFILFLATISALAEVPNLINYQGTLTDIGGNPITDTREMGFAIYADSVGGTPLWSETQSSIPINDGLFLVKLGSDTPIPPSIFDGNQLWLGITINPDVIELSPRQSLVTVPYGFKSGVADHASEADWADMATHATYADTATWTLGMGGITHADTADFAWFADSTAYAAFSGTADYASYASYANTAGSAQQATHSDTANYATYAGTAGYATYAPPDDDWTTSGSNIYRMTGNVGIGTTAPSVKLDLRGPLNVGTNGNGHDVNFYGWESGGRLFWDESKQALRSGMDFDGTYWSNANTGPYSFATGYNTKASGNGDVATGRYTVASGGNSTAMGFYSTASAENAVAMGEYATASGLRSSAIGKDVTAGPASDTHVLGRGLSYASPLVNNTQNSFMVGFGVTTPTLFVGGSNHRVGIGTINPTNKLDVEGNMAVGASYSGANAAPTNGMIIEGNVGINTTSPSYRLHVNGQAISGVSSIASGSYSTVNGGQNNSALGSYSTVGGGSYNYARGINSVVAGGGTYSPADSNSAMGDYSAVGGGRQNYTDGYNATIAGGYKNTAHGDFSAVSGGRSNSAIGAYSVVGGGLYNSARASNAVVAGGGSGDPADSNSTLGSHSVIGGGRGNYINGNGYAATISGGENNTASGLYSTVPGGVNNIAQGSYSVAMGRQAQALNSGSFVWADNSGVSFASTASNQFLIRASGGVGIGTNNPENTLHLFKSSGSLKLEIESDNGTPGIELDGTSGNFGIDFKESGTYKAGMGWNSTDDYFFLYESANSIVSKNGLVGIRTTNPLEALHVNGRVYVQTMDGTTSGSEVRWYNNRLYYYSSSQKYKDDIQPLDDKFDKILNAEPVSFTDKVSGERNIGFIAEDFEKLGLENLVVHRDGEPDGVKYELVSLYLLEIVKNQNVKIDELMRRLNAIETVNK